MASMAYSTWKRRPSGEKVLTPLSYSLLHQPGKQDSTQKEDEGNMRKQGSFR